MKKLLCILIAVILTVFVFSSCQKQNTEKTTNTETTTVAISNKDIKNGILKGEVYTNKSLGIKLYCPEGYNVQSFGDLDLSPDNLDVPNYDYYLVNKEDKMKTVAITVESANKIASIDDWIKSTNSTEKNEDATIGNRVYASVNEFNEDVNVVTFATYENGMIAKITFEKFTYDEAIKFIQDNFETK
ncbi:MAG: hypothetical protein IKF64_05385 [Eubacterium sp.]|nr:hypothetical protein [Eubacterium sp.]